MRQPFIQTGRNLIKRLFIRLYFKGFIFLYINSTLIIFILRILAISIWFILDGEFLYCTDELIEKIDSVKDDIKFWGEDLQSIEDIYKSSFNNKNNGELSAEDLNQKIELEKSISEAKHNIRTSIAQLKELQSRLQAFEESPIVILGKRSISDVQGADINVDNKRGSH